METLGIIGGLGPMASAYFLELLTRMTDAATDQEHLELLLHQIPGTPDRTAFILGESQDSPLPELKRAGLGLVRSGATVIAIPCMTAHYFQEELQEAIGAPVIHGIRETAQYLKDHGIGTVGIMATDGTIRSGIFARELEARGIRQVIPSAEGQRYVMDLIYNDVKAGIEPEMDKFKKVSMELREAGAEVIVLGCTELSMIKRDYPLGRGYLDALEVLAMTAVKTCGRLNRDYKELIT